jgi:hypothetical protein
VKNPIGFFIKGTEWVLFTRWPGIEFDSLRSVCGPLDQIGTEGCDFVSSPS